MFAGAWLYGIFDASIGSAAGPGVSLKVVPDHDVSAGSSANVGLRFAVGHLSSGW
jgi:hypothetical protein